MPPSAVLAVPVRLVILNGSPAVDAFVPGQSDLFRVTFDRFVLTVPNAQPGDSVTFSNTAGAQTKDAMESVVYFVAPGPCPDTWPTSFSFRAACDRCTTPIDPAGGSGTGSDGTGVDHGAGGCAVTGAREALATGALIARSRRRTYGREARNGSDEDSGRNAELRNEVTV